MMRNKKRGFSLAELLISLLVISIILAAAIPTVTKKNSAASEKIWHWTNTNNSAYFGVGGNQSALIGAAQIPFSEKLNDVNYITNFFADADIFQSAIDKQTISTRFTTSGDKLVLMKRTVSAKDPTTNKLVGKSSFMNSHISFYTIENKSDATPNDIVYAGRLSLDKHNIALGIGSLQSLAPDKAGYNTAIGHHSLLFNTTGLYNTAIGEKTLAYNTIGNGNVAIGYQSLRSLKPKDGDPTTAFSANTAIGTGSMSLHENGSRNTAVGFEALNNATGQYNTALGDTACTNLIGDYNLCLGYNVGSFKTAQYDDQKLNIGVSRNPDDPNLDTSIAAINTDTPIISGYMVPTAKHDKRLDVNTRIFSVNTFNGAKPVFYVRANLGDTGYDLSQPSNGEIFFNLRDTGKANKGSVITSFNGLSNGAVKQMNIYSYDRYDTNDATKYANININDMFNIKFQNNGKKIVSLTAQNDNPIDGAASDYATIKLNNLLAVGANAPNEQFFTIFKNDYSPAFMYDSGKDSIYSNVSDLYMSAQNDIKLQSETGSVISYSDLYLQHAGNTSVGTVVTPEYISIGFGGSNTKIQAGEINIAGLNVKSSIEDLRNKINIYSDARLKNIKGDNKAGLKEINALEVKDYTYKKDKEKTPHVGVIAQQLQKVFPNSVTKDEKGYFMIRTEEIFYAMVNSIKELLVMVQDLTSKVVGLDNKIEKLEQENQLLKKQNAEFEKRLIKLEQQAAK